MGTVRTIASRANPLLARLRKLAADPTAYRRQGEIWVEGEHLCAAWLERGRLVPLALIGDSAWQRPALRRLAEAAADVVRLPDALMAGLSTLGSAPPLAYVLPWPGSSAVDPGAASVVLDRVQDAGNAGSILRSAAAFGFSQVIALAGTAALWSPKVLRAGMGAHFALKLVEGVDAIDGLAVPLLAASPHAAQAIDAAKLPWPCAWVLGHEGQGVAPELLRRSAHVLRIPQPGGEESLNVAAAAAVCLYESSRQRRR